MVICCDFDGTCVTHDFPLVGKDIGAVPVLKELVENGHQLILWTMRSNRPKGGAISDPTIHDVTGNFLDDAVKWFERNEIPLYGIQENPTQKEWTTSKKCYAQLYIDDAALGCPLLYPKNYSEYDLVPLSDRPFVNWKMVRNILYAEGILKHK